MKRLCGAATIIALIATILPLGALEAQDGGSGQGFTVQLRGGPFTTDKLAFDELAPGGGTGNHNGLGGLFGGGSGFGFGAAKE